MIRHPQLFFLTGFMGVGKSYWGRKLAGLSGYNYYDTDEYIERQLNMRVSDLIPSKGEPYFRQAENKLLSELIGIIKKPGIISLGGGTLLDQRNIHIVKENGYLIWLKQRKDFLLDKDAVSRRPLYDPKKVKKLYNERKSSYEQSDYIVHLNKYPDDKVLERQLLKVIKV